MNKTSLSKQISREIQQFLTEQATGTDNYSFSTHKLVNRINLFETHTYPSGKFDSQGNYKYWYDVITPRIDSEIKNIDFDTKDITAYSPRPIDELPCIITNLKIKEYLRETGQAEEINSAIEEGSGWGNVVWKKVKGGYERVDLKNFYVINQTAESLEETPVIERHQMTSSELRAKTEVWKGVEEVIKEANSKTYKSDIGTQEAETTVPYYDIYERNGEVSIKDLKEYRGEKEKKGDEDKFVLARVIGAGSKGNESGVDIKHILFAEELKGKKMSDVYKEYHRGRYKSRWWREGLYELLFDIQVRCNQIGNQIAQGLELASKTVLRSDDKLIVSNILTDLRNGDIIKSDSLVQVQLRMDAFDQLANDWNRLIELANDLTNSREVVQGITPASGTPLGTTQLLNQNAGKLFDFIREKFAIPLSAIFEEWKIPELVKELKSQEILRLTGDSDMLGRLNKIIVDSWYLGNLVFLPPHTKEIAETLKAEKLEELTQRPELLMKGTKQLFESFKPHISVIITGEQVNLDADINTLVSFANSEIDPVRRSAILELAAKKKGLDFGKLAKSPPMQPQPQQQAPATSEKQV